MGTRKGIGNYSRTTDGGQVKSRRLDCRTTQGTYDRLDWIKAHSAILKGKSYAEIIEHLIDDHIIMQELFVGKAPRFHKLR